MTARAAGVRAIVTYKVIKASVQLAVTLLLCVLWPLGLPDKIQHLAAFMRHHATHGWALRLADVLAGSSAKRLQLTVIALGLDAALTATEAWALHSGRWWGPWLVVAATGSLLPFEVYEFLRVPRLSRALIFTLNLAILVYLARRAWLERRELRGRR